MSVLSTQYESREKVAQMENGVHPQVAEQAKRPLKSLAGPARRAKMRVCQQANARAKPIAGPSAAGQQERACGTAADELSARRHQPPYLTISTPPCFDSAASGVLP